MKDLRKFALVAGSVSTLLVAIILTVLSNGENLQLNTQSVEYLDTGWSYIEPNKTLTAITLPADMDVPAGEEFGITATLPDIRIDGSICFRTSLQTIRVVVDGKEIFRRQYDRESIINTPIASAWVVVPLSHVFANKTISVYFSSPYEAYSGYCNTVFYGSNSAVLFHLIQKYGAGFIIASVIFLIGLGLIIVSFFVRSVADRSLLYIGFFALFLSIWLLAESKMLQFFCGSQFLLGSTAYLSLSVFPIPLLLYISDTLAVKKKHGYRVLGGLFAADFIVCTVLQLTGIADFYESLPITHVLLIAGAIYMVYSLVRECVKHRNPEVVSFVRSFCVFLVFALMEAVNFYFFIFTPISFYLRIGLMIFILMLCINSVKRIRKDIDRGKEAAYFARMAYLDILTNGKNRNAFDRDMKQFDSEVLDAENIRLVFLDLNDLKSINDQHGHAAGDEAIRTTYEYMKVAFGGFGGCYRIGGDEFACILTDCDEACYEAARQVFNTLVAKANEQTKYEYSVAVGSAIFNKSIDGNLSSLLERVDRMMYQNKRGEA